ncbi:peptidylprolyl isomerase [Candidatus Woesearchaeota archaeon]|nr:peptidylprolyl isomerase [Candidatus Woesearchaeota archaeon]
MGISKGDFIVLAYTAKVKESGRVFDTTDEAIAKKEGLAGQGATFAPITVCVGEGMVIPGLDTRLEGCEPGKGYEFEIAPEDGFGKKSAKLIQLITASRFKKDQIAPQPGLQVNVDGNVGVVKTVSGGRILVDFNHPLSGRTLVYAIRVERKLETAKEKLDGYLAMILGSAPTTSVNEGTATVTTPAEIPSEVQERLAEKVTSLIKDIAKVEFRKAEKPKAALAAEPEHAAPQPGSH